jgi:intracellular sulfur oxidation DsrE/DsrF family protein
VATAAPLALLLAAAVPAGAQQPLGPATTGPIIEGFGPVYDVEAPEFATPIDFEYRLVFDVKTAPEDTTAVNPAIETLARFLNMHGRAGVPLDRMRLALVLHGAAGKDALDDEAFHERYGHDNPNRGLIEQLAEAGVRIILCGQTAMHRGLPPARLAEPVEVALSAMTALATLQAQGYALIAF